MPPHLLHVFPTFAVGGAQMRFAQLARLYGTQFRHTVLSLDGNCAMRDYLPSDLDISILSPNGNFKSGTSIWPARRELSK